MEFSERIDTILQGRKISPWARHLGFSNSFVTRTRENNPPNSVALGLISRVERVSLNWLLTGSGVPFIVSTEVSEAEFAQQLESLSIESWSATSFECDERPGHIIVALEQPGQIAIKNKSAVSYTIHEVVYGAKGKAVKAALKQHYPQRHTAQLNSLSFDALAEGQMGNVGLESLKKTPNTVAENHKSYWVPYQHTIERIEADFKSLAKADKARASDLLERLLRVITNL